jgi:PIN domain nuclease of toxin-antitoxin system
VTILHARPEVVAVADTQAILWWINADRRLSPLARRVCEAARRAGDRLGVSAMTLIELIYLVERGRVPPDGRTRLLDVIDAPSSEVAVIPVDRAVADAALSIDRAAIPELPDRVIAATALHLGVPLVTSDLRIRASGVATIW